MFHNANFAHVKLKEIFMRSTAILTNEQISEAYLDYSDSIYKYILYKINDEEISKDMMHDTFLKVLEHRGDVRIDTVKSFLFVTARNIVIDYVRRQKNTFEIFSDYYKSYEDCYVSVESEVNAKDIFMHEMVIVNALPHKRKKVYTLSRFKDMSVGEIAIKMNISKRTVENHLRISRQEVRNYIRQCI